MKKKILPLLIGSALLSGLAFAAETSENEYVQIVTSVHKKMDNRIAELREYASDENNIITEGESRYIEVNALKYEINKDNYILFEMPEIYLDETAIRNVFNFISDEWELTEYASGVVAVNKLVGNYDYGNGCLIEYSPKGNLITPTGSSHLLVETASCEPKEGELLNQVSFLGEGNKLTFETFGYQNETDFIPKSLVIKDDKIYIGNAHGAFSRIERFDLKTQQVLPAIIGFTLNGVDEVYRVVSDVAEHDGRLYVASLSSNRIDIYDMANNDKIIMSLGTGDWGGDTFDKTLTHPSSVAANDDYVFVIDQTNKISVYSQNDVTVENHKNTQKHAFLALEENIGIYLTVKMEVVSDELIVSFDNTKTYVFDISKLEKSKTLIEPKGVFTKTLRRNVYESEQGDVFTGTSTGKIELFSEGALAFTDSGIVTSAKDEFSVYFDGTEQKEMQTMASFDLAVENNLVAILQGRSVLLAPLETLRIHQSNNSSDFTKNIDLTDPDVARTPLLFDGESWESLTVNHETRIARILSGKQQLDTLSITSYAAQPTKNLTVEARFNNKGEWFKLGSIAQLDAFSSFNVDNSLIENNYYPTVDGQQSVAIKGLENLSYFPSDLLDIRLMSKTDTFVQKISDFDSKWRIRFGTYSPAAGPWGKITPAYAREWMIMIANFAYVMDSPEFEHLWFNFKESIGEGTDEFFGNAGPINGPGGNFTAEDYQRIYDAFINRDLIELGVSTIGGGLGGGSVLGIDTWIYYSHYYRSGIGIVGHEFGHLWGSHSSGFSDPKRGLELMTQDLHQMFIRSESLPYMDDELNAFYKTPADELYNSVDHNFRVPRAADNVNVVERYFAENPMPMTK